MICPEAGTEFPIQYSGANGYQNRIRDAVTSRRNRDRRYFDPPSRSSSILGKQICASQNLRRSGRDRYRECAVVQRTRRAQPRLTEALEQQTATSEVLRVIAGSPTELQPVLDAVTESAVRLAGAKRGHIRQYDGEFLRLVASYGESPEQLAVFQAPVRPRAESRSGRAFLERRPIHDLDAQVERSPDGGSDWGSNGPGGPALREDSPIGVFTIWRDLVQPFTDRQIELVKTFADQAVVAIENVRLFQELSTQCDLTSLGAADSDE